MTRKRFVKLCMSIGYSRNQANALARLCLMSNSTYNSYFRLVKMKKAFDDVGVSIESLAKTLQRVIRFVVDTCQPILTKFCKEVFE
jgi:hypothetical protein